MSDTPALHVALALPPAPYLLASPKFLTTLAEVEDQVASLALIADPAQAQLAAGLQTRLTTAGSELEKARVALTAPFLDAQRAIKAAADGPQARIAAAKIALSKSLTTYTLAEQAKARAAEEARQRELAALELQRQKEQEAEEQRQAELQKQADEVAAAAAKGPRVFDFDEEDAPPPEPIKPTATEERIAAIQAAPVVAVPKPSGVKLVVKLVATVVDINLVPDIFIKKEVKLAAINTTYCAGWRPGSPIPVCPGVKFEQENSTVSTGRQGF